MYQHTFSDLYQRTYEETNFRDAVEGLIVGIHAQLSGARTPEEYQATLDALDKSTASLIDATLANTEVQNSNPSPAMEKGASDLANAIIAAINTAMKESGSWGGHDGHDHGHHHHDHHQYDEIGTELDSSTKSLNDAANDNMPFDAKTQAAKDYRLSGEEFKRNPDNGRNMGNGRKLQVERDANERSQTAYVSDVATDRLSPRDNSQASRDAEGKRLSNRDAQAVEDKRLQDVQKSVTPPTNTQADRDAEAKSNDAKNEAKRIEAARVAAEAKIIKA